MRLSHLFVVAAVAGMAMLGVQSPASATQAGAAFAPAATKLAVSNDVIKIGRRCWWRYGRRICRGYGRHYRGGYYGYGYRRRPGVGIYIGPRRGYGWRRGWRRGYW